MFIGGQFVVDTTPSREVARVTAGNGQVLTINEAQIQRAPFLMTGMTVYGPIPGHYGGEKIKMVIIGNEPRSKIPLPRPKSGPGSRGPSKKSPLRYPVSLLICMSGDGCAHYSIDGTTLWVLKREYERKGAQLDEYPVGGGGGGSVAAAAAAVTSLNAVGCGAVGGAAVGTSATNADGTNTVGTVGTAGAVGTDGTKPVGTSATNAVGVHAAGPATPASKRSRSKSPKAQVSAAVASRRRASRSRSRSRSRSLSPSY